MDLIASWVVYPAVLVAICVGNGLLVEYMTFRPPPRAPPSGGGRVRPADAADGAAAGRGPRERDRRRPGSSRSPTRPPSWRRRPSSCWRVLGLALGVRRRFPIAPWAIAAAAGVFAVYAAPIVLSGEATFAGFIKLDDTATWLALTDRVARARPRPRRARALDLRGDARGQPRRRLSDRRLPPARGRLAADRGRRRLADPALHGVPRRRPGARRCGLSRGRCAAAPAAARGRCIRRRAARRCSTATTSGAGSRSSPRPR